MSEEANNPSLGDEGGHALEVELVCDNARSGSACPTSWKGGREDVLMVIPAALVGPEMSRVLMCFALPADSRDRISIDVVLGAST